MLIRKKRHCAKPAKVASTVSALGLALLGCLSLASFKAQAYVEQGRLHDAASWRSEEFKLDWGLAAVGADYAYARGLSGNGMRVGLFDSGVNLNHLEFAGKTPQSILVSAPGCSGETVLSADVGCFFSEGDKPQINYQHLSAQDLQSLAELLADRKIEPEVKAILQEILDDQGPHYSPHGTHIAGTLLANRDGLGMHGIAYGADLSTMRRASHTFSPSDEERDTLSISPPRRGVCGRLRTNARAERTRHQPQLGRRS